MRLERWGTAGFALLLLGGMSFLTLIHGPSSRVFVSPRRCVPAASTNAILDSWRAAGVKGRVAILLTFNANGEDVRGVATGIRYLEEAMNEGIVRTAYHVVADGEWSMAAAVLAGAPGVRPVPTGFADLYGAGRLYVLPMSKLPSIPEPPLIVVAPDEWRAEDVGSLMRVMSATGDADLVAVLRGTPEQVALLCGARSGS